MNTFVTQSTFTFITIYEILHIHALFLSKEKLIEISRIILTCVKLLREYKCWIPILCFLKNKFIEYLSKFMKFAIFYSKVARHKTNITIKLAQTYMNRQ